MTNGDDGEKFQLLSPEWIARAKDVRAEYSGKIPALPLEVRINQIVTDVPFGESPLHGHIDTSTGAMIVEEGHLDDADLTMTLDYETFSMMFRSMMERDPAPAMAAFMSGKIRIDGDISKMMQFQVAQAQQAADDPLANEIADRVLAFTAT